MKSLNIVANRQFARKRERAEGAGLLQKWAKPIVAKTEDPFNASE